MSALNYLFSFLCSQDPLRSFAIEGRLLPFCERPALWKRRRFFTVAFYFNHLQQGQSFRPIHKILNIMVLRTLCLSKHNLIMVSNSIDVFLLHCPSACTYRIALRPVLPVRNNCLLCVFFKTRFITFYEK